ncbi:MAG: alcohol dehydrogenase catalytic domain-containing protein, partial [Nitrospiraceae bacterium]|nr:alcohol dehydrogenase catalytic domain-containing protein [Nitrospiraceae bacterium]
MTIPAFGDPSVLQLADLPDPTPGEQELLIEVHAAGLNPVDTKLRSGSFRAPVALPMVPGFDVSGVVAAVGKAVTTFKVGDEVFASPPLFSRAARNVRNAMAVSSVPPLLSTKTALKPPMRLPISFISFWRVAITSCATAAPIMPAVVTATVKTKSRDASAILPCRRPTRQTRAVGRLFPTTP